MVGTALSVSTSQDELNAILCEAVPRQGAWTDEEYLWLTDRSSSLIEFTDGYVQELPMPTSSHPCHPCFALSPVPRLAWAARRRGAVRGTPIARA